ATGVSGGARSRVVRARPRRQAARATLGPRLPWRRRSAAAGRPRRAGPARGRNKRRTQCWRAGLALRPSAQSGILRPAPTTRGKDAMEKRKLGKSQIAIAPLMFGGNVFGWTTDEAMSFRLLDA